MSPQVTIGQRAYGEVYTKISKGDITMEKTLEMEFKTAIGGKKVISVANPMAGLTNEQATTAMTTLINSQVFESAGSPITEAVEARIRTTDVVALA